MWSALECVFFVFFFKQKTAYEMRISDWSSDVCSSDLGDDAAQAGNDVIAPDPAAPAPAPDPADMATQCDADAAQSYIGQDASEATVAEAKAAAGATGAPRAIKPGEPVTLDFPADRSGEHTSELQSLMRNSYAVLCFKKKI